MSLAGREDLRVDLRGRWRERERGLRDSQLGGLSLWARDQQLHGERPAGRRRELGTGKNRLVGNEQHPRRHRRPRGQ